MNSQHVTVSPTAITINYTGARTRSARTKLNKILQPYGIELDRDELESQWVLFSLHDDFDPIFYRAGITIQR